MIKSVEIENYKNFKHLKMENFKLINFFTGQNDTGKTNLLESLYINTGAYDPITNRGSLPPEHAVHISEFRKIKLNTDNLKAFFIKETPLIPLVSAPNLSILLSLLLSNTPHKTITVKILI
ncbi:hypothetical protein HpBT220_06880 [Helicobacter pylori]